MPRRHWRRGIATFAATLASTLILAGPAGAAAEINPTTQATAATAAWLPYAPAPATPGAVCLIDSGVNRNSDTSAAVITRIALDHGTPDDVDTDEHHGTRMAMIMAAARNGSGMLGAWPMLRIVSVRAAAPPPAGQPTTYPFTAYTQAIRNCLNLSSPTVPIHAIEIAIGRQHTPTDSEIQIMGQQVSSAHAFGVNVIAAAGNDGGPVQPPASLAGVFAVGAGDHAGALCEGSSRGAGLDLISPGCELDSVNPLTLAPEAGWWGTSQASAFAAAVIAALRSYKPSLTWEQAEQLLTSTSKAGMLKAAAAFRAAGLGTIVDAGLKAMPKPPPPPVKRWSAPKVRSARYRHGLLTVRLAGRPPGARVQLAVYRRVIGGRVRKAKTLSKTMNTIRTRLPTRPVKLAITFRDPRVPQHDSKTTTVTKIAR